MPIGPADEGDWGSTPTPGAGLAAAAALFRQRGSRQGRLPDRPPKAKPGPGARQPPASRHAPAPSATDERLREYIAKQMRMSPIDQPLMLMKLLGHGFARQQPARLSRVNPLGRLASIKLAGEGP
jgi:hypothetical protein